MNCLRGPSTVISGGTIEESVQALLRDVPGSRTGKGTALILTDEDIVKTGFHIEVEDSLKKGQWKPQILAVKRGEPTVHDFLQVLEQVRQAEPELLVGLGGGSVLDVVKLCSLLYDKEINEGNILKVGAEAEGKIPTVLIPTTCGTGAEATCNGILAFPEQEQKVGIVNPHMIPDYVILNAETIRYLPPGILASTVVDALTHCVECYTSKKANPFSDFYGEAGTRLIFRYALQAYRCQEDMEAKQALMQAAYYGGLAITASGTTAVHALSYPLGGKYHIPHGIANAVLFAPVIRFNRPCCESLLARLNDQVAPEEYGKTDAWKAEAFTERLETLVRNLGIPVSLKEYGITARDVDILVARGMKVRRLLDNNCRLMTEADARIIYQEIL